MTQSQYHILKVFLSYSREDKDAVDEFYQRLMLEGIDVWLDTQKILPGQDWELEIRKAVRDCDVILICISNTFNQKGYRQHEVRIALDQASQQPEGEIFIIPIRLEACDTLESLRRWQWVDIFEPEGYELLMRALRKRANSIRAIVPDYESTNNSTEQLKHIKRNKPDNIKIPSKASDISTDKLDKNVGDKFLTETLPTMVLKNKQIKEWSIILIDIDDTSLINKHYGFEVGDKVFEIVKNLIYKYGNAEQYGRCGDDTFYIFILNNIEKAIQISESLRKNIKNYAWVEIAKDLSVTASFGVAKFRTPEPAQACVVRAGTGLLLAKKEGGNKVRKGPQFLTAKQSLDLRDYYS